MKGDAVNMLFFEKMAAVALVVAAVTLSMFGAAWSGSFNPGMGIIKLALWAQIGCAAFILLAGVIGAGHWKATNFLWFTFLIGSIVSAVFLSWSALVVLQGIQIKNAIGIQVFWQEHATPQMIWIAIMYSMYIFFRNRTP